jgi:hypothetical protein
MLNIKPSLLKLKTLHFKAMGQFIKSCDITDTKGICWLENVQQMQLICRSVTNNLRT